jgi:hypothetical protein
MATKNSAGTCNDWEMLSIVDAPFVVRKNVNGKAAFDVWKRTSELAKRKSGKQT